MTTKHPQLNVFLSLFKREFVARYRRTLLGLFWTLVPTVFGSIGGLLVAPTGDATQSNLLFFIFLKLMTFQTFFEAFSMAAHSSIRYRNVLQYAAVNPVLVPSSTTLFVAINLVVRIFILLGAAIYWHIPLGWPVLACLPLWGAMIVMGLGFGMLISPFGLLYWDLRYSYGYIAAAIFLISPIFYSVSSAPEWLRMVIALNPVTHFVLSVEALFGTSEVPALGLFYSFLFAAILFFFGKYFYRRTISRALCQL
jgi:lipopolysaccharide transport system permease protein